MGSSGFLIAGLGNPGSKYTNTRHNIGFFFLEHLVQSCGLQLTQEKFKGLYCSGRMCGKKVVFVEPQTYMNLSGDCLGRFIDFYKIDTANILVLHDDIDLESCRIKVVAGGGTGGHNGVRSVAKYLGTNDFARLKIGVGRPAKHDGRETQPVDKFVLSRFSDEESRSFEEKTDLVLQAVELFITDGVAACMNQINGQRNKI